MRIYDGNFTVGRILEKCRTGSNPRDSLVSFNPSERAGSNEVDIAKLSRIIDQIPVEEIRARRKRLNIFYEEVLVSADPERGVSFSACLMILAHYKIIVDSKSLRLEEFLRRRYRLQRTILDIQATHRLLSREDGRRLAGLNRGPPSWGDRLDSVKDPGILLVLR